MIMTQRLRTTRSTQTEISENMPCYELNSRGDDSHETSGFVADDSDESSAGRADRHTMAPSQDNPAPNEMRRRQATSSFARCDPDLATDRRGALLARGMRRAVEARHAEAVEGTKAVLAAQLKHRRCDSNPLVARVENNESTEDGVPSGSQQQRLHPRQSC